jgi:uncharacterized membrane protein YeaQ/YmgE (transglycosylase-associated protein family)
MASLNGTAILGLLLSWVLLVLSVPVIAMNTKPGSRLSTCLSCLLLGGFGSFAGGFLGISMSATSEENIVQILPALLGLAGGVKLALMLLKSSSEESP